jgi:hypothetical protein
MTCNTKEVIFSGTMNQFNGVFQAIDIGSNTNVSIQFTLSGAAGLTVSNMELSNDKVGWIVAANQPTPITGAAPATVYVEAPRLPAGATIPGVLSRYVRFTLANAVLTDTMTVTVVAK